MRWIFSAFLAKFQRISAHFSAILCKVFCAEYFEKSAHFLHKFRKISRPGRILDKVNKNRIFSPIFRITHSGNRIWRANVFFKWILLIDDANYWLAIFKFLQQTFWECLEFKVEPYRSKFGVCINNPRQPYKLINIMTESFTHSWQILPKKFTLTRKEKTDTKENYNWQFEILERLKS